MKPVEPTITITATLKKKSRDKLAPVFLSRGDDGHRVYVRCGETQAAGISPETVLWICQKLARADRDFAAGLRKLVDQRDARSDDRLNAAMISPEAAELSTPLDDTKLTIRTKNVLHNLGAVTIMDLLNVDSVSLLRARNCGPRTMCDVWEFADRYMAAHSRLHPRHSFITRYGESPIEWVLDEPDGAEIRALAHSALERSGS